VWYKGGEEVGMPIYEFFCRPCGTKVEKLVKMGELATPICSKCGEQTVKVYSVPALQFVGTGFYNNDYKKNSPGKEES
jgi:putative FmdB family regulatory protein